MLSSQACLTSGPFQEKSFIRGRFLQLPAGDNSSSFQPGAILPDRGMVSHLEEGLQVGEPFSRGKASYLKPSSWGKTSCWSKLTGWGRNPPAAGKISCWGEGHRLGEIPSAGGSPPAPWKASSWGEASRPEGKVPGRGGSLLAAGRSSS